MGSSRRRLEVGSVEVGVSECDHAASRRDEPVAATAGRGCDAHYGLTVEIGGGPEVGRSAEAVHGPVGANEPVALGRGRRHADHRRARLLPPDV